MAYFFGDCVYCQESTNRVNVLCNRCIENLTFYEGCFNCDANMCICGIKSFIPLFYDGIIKPLILNFKYNDKTYLSDCFIDIIVNYTDIAAFCNQDTILIPIPTARSKLFKRTYNQSVLLCKSLAKIFKCEIAYFVFKKRKDSSQSNKSLNERFLNAQFIQLDDISNIINKNVIIVDDVVASGSTIMRCVSLLQPIAKNVYVAAIAKS
jgi:ComF family protein